MLFCIAKCTEIEASSASINQLTHTSMHAHRIKPGTNVKTHKSSTNNDTHTIKTQIPHFRYYMNCDVSVLQSHSFVALCTHRQQRKCTHRQQYRANLHCKKPGNKQTKTAQNLGLSFLVSLEAASLQRLARDPA